MVTQYQLCELRLESGIAPFYLDSPTFSLYIGFRSHTNEKRC
jgi:hypothetical protein